MASWQDPGKALDLLRRARAVRGATKPACMLVPSRVDRRTAIGRRIHATLERFGLKVGPAIRQRSAHIEAFEAGAWIGVHAPGSPAHREIRVLKDRVLELFEAMLDPAMIAEGMTFLSEDHQEASTAFVEKRDPVFRGR